MKKNIKTIIGLIIAFIIGISTTATAATVFNSKDITYSNSGVTTKTNVKDSLDELYSKIGKCPDGQYCYTEPLGLSDKVELGDYISMIPTSTSYSPPSNLTGCIADVNCTQNTINPSELNLWRVISKNSDGTVDAVSEHISSKTVLLYGVNGYLNLSGIFNRISEQYINSKYVTKARHIAYSSQVEYCKSWNNDVCPAWIKSNDQEVILEVLGTLKATLPDGSEGRYYYPYRAYNIYEDGIHDLHLFVIYEDGHLGGQNLFTSNDSAEVVTERLLNFAVRPIISFKSTVELSSGSGTADSPYILN